MGPYLGVPRAPWVQQNQKKTRIPGSPKKTQVENPKNAEKSKKSKFRKNEAVSSNIFAQDHMANLLRLTGELGIFGFWIEGPEIWPSQKGGGVAGVALPPPPDK